MSGAALIALEALKMAVQAYALIAQQNGVTKEQAKVVFNETFDKFYAASDQPVDPVKP